ncbi:MAG: hypothetical protein IK002_10025 [Treponema sp.]|uniref:hypothetical protein n=1 Tax=Treponema sp. TaxID=166 RepID=UPI00298E2163|nr:hypothetical protein [Treponema sp.]MBR5934312.1 hypothetical protein [Treponema sp.]
MNKLKVIFFFTILSILSAIAFEISHAGHENHCHEDNCPVCIVLEIIHSSKKINPVQTFSVSITKVFYIVEFILSSILFLHFTLVSQKVKISI